MKRSLTRLLAATAIAFVAACPVLRAQNLVSNPSFETGSFTNDGSGFQLLAAGSTNITNWVVITDDIAWGITPNSDEIVAHGGTHFLDLEGPGLYAVPYGGVSQTVPTVSGQVYHFSFFLGTQQSHRNDNGPISVSASAGSLTQSFTFNPTGDNTQWGEFGFDFTATGNSTPVSITGTFTNDGAYIGLDDVSVVAVAPEPAATAFVVGGIVIAGAICYRRRVAAGKGQAV